MFEQSLLVDHAGARKTATFAASLTAQILVAGVLLLTPLFYHDVLPMLHLPEIVPMLTITRAPWPPVIPAHTPARSSGLALPGPFRPPPVARSASPQFGMVIVVDDAPVLGTIPGIAGIPIGSPTALPRPEPPAVTADAVKLPDAPIRVGGDVLSAKLITRVVPIYPRPAVQLRISGVVHLLGVIAKDGTIQRLQVLNGHPLLRQAALDAVSQWVYRPTLLNGMPVEVEAPIDVVFTLQ